jgi:hypothetical protein
MDKKLKLQLADMVIEFLSRNQKDEVIVARQIGTLNKAQGQRGFKLADIGTPIFDIGDMYMIMFESLDGKRNAEVTYYKETLARVIDFTDKVEQTKAGFGTIKNEIAVDFKREDAYDG